MASCYDVGSEGAERGRPGAGGAGAGWLRAAVSSPARAALASGGLEEMESKHSSLVLGAS